MINDKQWNASAAHQLVRYEALAQLQTSVKSAKAGKKLASLNPPKPWDYFGANHFPGSFGGFKILST